MERQGCLFPPILIIATHQWCSNCTRSAPTDCAIIQSRESYHDHRSVAVINPGSFSVNAEVNTLKGSSSSALTLHHALHFFFFFFNNHYLLASRWGWLRVKLAVIYSWLQVEFNFKHLQRSTWINLALSINTEVKPSHTLISLWEFTCYQEYFQNLPAVGSLVNVSFCRKKVKCRMNRW